MNGSLRVTTATTWPPGRTSVGRGTTCGAAENGARTWSTCRHAHRSRVEKGKHGRSSNLTRGLESRHRYFKYHINHRNPRPMGAMVVDRESWPENGRVGRIEAGEYAGAYLLLVAEIRSSWAFYISDDPRVTDTEHLRTDDFWVADGDLLDVLAQMSVNWVRADQDDQVETEVFDIRSEWARRRRRSSGLRSPFRRLHPGSDG